MLWFLSRIFLAFLFEKMNTTLLSFDKVLKRFQMGAITGHCMIDRMSEYIAYPGNDFCRNRLGKEALSVWHIQSDYVLLLSSLRYVKSTGWFHQESLVNPYEQDRLLYYIYQYWSKQPFIITPIIILESHMFLERLAMWADDASNELHLLQFQCNKIRQHHWRKCNLKPMKFRNFFNVVSTFNFTYFNLLCKI